MRISIDYLADRPEVIPEIQGWFESEWAEYYGPDAEGDALSDLHSYSSKNSLPIGLVALVNDEVCGFAALRNEAFPSHPQFSPWLGAAIVGFSMRGKGIGAKLFAAIENEAKARSFRKIYCATATSKTLLKRCGWSAIAKVMHQGHEVSVYEKVLY